ncbi:MAG: restriction endonuclease subunit S [Desulfatiglandales bacterium]
MISQKTKLGDVCTIKTGKLDSNAAVEGGKYPFFTCAQETFAIDKYAYDTEAVLLGGNNANGIFPLKYYHGKFNAYQRTYIIESKSDQVALNRYLYFFLRPVLDYFKNASIGAATQYLTKPVLVNLKIDLPDVDSQKKIIDIAYSYDDLININRRRIQLLEETARLIFREWFVYFRFPGYEKVKIVDGVPEGWERIKFKEIIDTIESGGRPKGGAIEEGIPSIGAENVNGIGKYDYSSEKYVPEEYYHNMKKGKVMSKDVLLYKDGANIGRVTIVGHGFPHNKCCVNEHVFILRTKNNIQNWLYFFLSQEFVQQAVANLNSNSAQPGISQEKLSGLKIIFPSRKIVRLFDVMAEDMVRQIFMLSIQNQKLAQARDLLLPRLMSGKIEV